MTINRAKKELVRFVELKTTLRPAFLDVILEALEDLETYKESEINPCRGCDDYDGQGGCKSNGGCRAKIDEASE